MSEAGDSIQAEGAGETVGEARWTALRDLERQVPGLDRDAVEYVVLSEGERGLLGVGREPARVIARVVAPPATPTPAAARPVGEEAEGIRELVRRMAGAIADGFRVDVEEDDERILTTVDGPEAGLLIGRHGQTIDAIQHLAIAVLLARGGSHREVVVDAQGYRARRERALRDLALRAATDAVKERCPMELDPMSSAERKVVHLALADREDVETTSEGREPARFVVISPRGV
jgi:spoIIIJ-associated protein